VFHVLGHRTGRVVDRMESFAADALDSYSRLIADTTKQR
jgi:hypothetical protein